MILPAHLAHLKVNRKAESTFWVKAWARVQGRSDERSLNGFTRRVYQPLLRILLPLRYLTFGVFIAILIVVVGLIPAGKLRAVPFPDIFRDSVSATLELEQGLSVEYLHENTLAVAAGLEEAVAELEKKSGDEILKHLSISSSSNTMSTISAELTVSESRVTTTADIVKLWRKKVRGIAGTKSLVFGGTAGPRGQGLNIQLESQNLDILEEAANDLKQQVGTYNGVFDISDTFDSGQPEIQVDVTPAGQASGFTKSDLANNVRSSFFGIESQRIQRGRDEVKVMVRYPFKERESLETLREMRVRSDDGTAVPFSIVASPKYGESLASVERYDFNRIVTVKAEIDKSVTSGDVVLNLLEKEYFADFRARFPEVSISLSGNAEEQRKSNASLKQGFLFSTILIYILLAIPLKSYIRPLVIMSVIPFGIVGALLGHFIIGIPVSILSVFGILALSGIVVNDSLVLVYRIKRAGGNG